MEEIMTHDFNRIIDRTNTHSLKWDFREELCGRRDVLPLWVADMDFEAPQEVQEAVRKRASHGIYGYTDRKNNAPFIRWMKSHHGWTIEPGWVLYLHGVIPAIHMAIQACTKPGDSIIVQTPVYRPFMDLVKRNGRELVINPLTLIGTRYEMDFDNLERSLKSTSRLFILCSPHNPVGRVWHEEELRRLSEICKTHNIIVVSDEIHCDLIMPGHKFIPFSTVSDDAAQRTIACTAPNKTFNLAGLSTANVVIPNPDLRRLFKEEMQKSGESLTNIFGMTAQDAAYEHGDRWLDELLRYVHSNYEFLASFLKERLPSVGLTPLEGTYLAWLDFRTYGMKSRELKEFLLSRAGVWLSEGSWFGAEGDGFMRMNLACPRSRVEEALERMARAFAAARQ